MSNFRFQLVSASLLGMMVFGGCSSGVQEHYVSSHIEGAGTAEQKINLEEVQKAFWDSKGKDFNEWMATFEKRVNEIYDGKEVVSIDATRDNGKLLVTGYIDKDNKQGFQPGDEKLFSIEQTGDAVKDEMPYRVSNGYGQPYYEGHHSILDSPIIQYMLLSHALGGWGGRYYTPAPQVVVLQHARDTFRASPSYSSQQASNKSFFSRFSTNSAGGLQSKNKFGFGSSPSATSTRSFGGTSSSTSGGTSSSSFGSMWGGRRSSSSSGFGSSGFSRSRSWGGFRRR